jgi:hypothetical protein
VDLTDSELADRAGYDPSDLRLVPHDEMPLGVLARLSETAQTPAFSTPRPADTDPTEATTDSVVIGAYLAESVNGPTRDALAQALDWSLLRVERALSGLDNSLRACGMRLGLRAGHIRIVSRAEHIQTHSYIALEQLDAPDVEPEIAKIVWEAIYGIDPRQIEQWDERRLEALESAVRRDLVFWWYGRLRTTMIVEYSVRLGRPRSVYV